MTDEDPVLEPSNTDEAEGAIISTGNSEIDGKLGGGVPVGSLTLIERQSASGKSVLAQQFTWGSLWAGHKVVFYSTERTISGHVRQMESLGLEATDFLLMGSLKIFPVTRVGETEPTVLLEQLIDDFGKHPDHDLVLVDSLTPMITPTSILDTITFFEKCRVLCSSGKTIVVTIHAYSLDEDSRARVRSMCDADLSLHVESVGDQLVNVLRVMKVSGATRTTGNIVSFVVEPMMGLRIIPLSYTKV